MRNTLLVGIGLTIVVAVSPADTLNLWETVDPAAPGGFCRYDSLAESDSIFSANPSWLGSDPADVDAVGLAILSWQALSTGELPTDFAWLRSAIATQVISHEPDRFVITSSGLNIGALLLRFNRADTDRLGLVLFENAGKEVYHFTPGGVVMR